MATASTLCADDMQSTSTCMTGNTGATQTGTLTSYRPHSPAYTSTHQAYNFGTGVITGADDGCTDGIVLNAQTDPSCNLKCDRANGFFGESASLTCTDELGDISNTAPRCEPCQPQAGCSGEGKGKACSDSLGILDKLTCTVPDAGYTLIPGTDIVKLTAKCGDREVKLPSKLKFTSKKWFFVLFVLKLFEIHLLNLHMSCFSSSHLVPPHKLHIMSGPQR
jgi:hypothetical protein